MPARATHVRLRAALAFACACLCAPAAARAQGGDRSHWGISVSFAPVWTANATIKELFVEEPGTLEGKEFTIGVVRGTSGGGDWGVSFVRKTVDDAVFSVVEGGCEQQVCFESSRAIEFRQLWLRGVEFHWSRPFVTIADRVQIGITLAGGAAWPEGTVVESFNSVLFFTNPFTGEVQINENQSTSSKPAKEALYEIFPLGKAEVQGAVIVHPSFKIRVSGGFNFPGTGVRISAVYLIGA